MDDTNKKNAAYLLPIVLIEEGLMAALWFFNTSFDNMGGGLHSAFYSIASLSRLFAYVLNPALAYFMIAGWSDLDLGINAIFFLGATALNIVGTTLWFHGIEDDYNSFAGFGDMGMQGEMGG